MKVTINLASRHYLNQRATDVGTLMVIASLVIVILLLGNGFLQDYQLTQTYRSHLDELKTELHGQQPERIDPQEIAGRRAEYERARTLLQHDAFRWTALFDRMEAILPNGISLINFSPDYEKDSLKISGLAKDLQSLQRLIDNLYDDQFEPVYLNSQGQTRVDDGRGGERPALTFSISLGKVF